MKARRDYRFSTVRVLVDEWHSFAQDEWPQQDLANVAVNVLTERVTQSLPPSWQGSYTIDRALRWIAERDNEGVTLLAVDKADKQAIGFVLLFEEGASGNLRLGYMLKESAWGKGFASELVAGFTTWSRCNDIRLITGGVLRGNIASRRVLEKCGFVAEPATDEQDEELFTLRLGPPQNSPQ